MAEIITHPANKIKIAQIIKRKPHAVLFSGGHGTGLYTIVLDIAKQLQSTPIIVAHDEKGAITIDSIRSLYRQTANKKTGVQAVILDDADKMTLSAQQAFLKLLEEPTENTVFLLTSHQPQSLLPTIHSRLQRLELVPLSLRDTQAYIKDSGVQDSTKVTQLLYMAAGKPAEIQRLLSDEAYFRQRAAGIRQAKEFIETPIYQKLITIYKIGNDREAAQQLLEQVLAIIKLHLIQNATSDLRNDFQRYVKALEKLHEDGNVRTQLLRAVI